ncbi:MAG: hypothetical protein FWG90_01845 [Oscillospiraceae bacterium]|nr:hypothetical protein [Oscillospiraceae bacterium]
MLASDESYERVVAMIEEIDECCETCEDYDEWYDVAASCVTDCFEELADNQIEMTCVAFIEYIEPQQTKDENLAKGLFYAVHMSLTEYVEHKERFLLDCNFDDDDDEREAKVILEAFKKCVKWLNHAFPEYSEELEN